MELTQFSHGISMFLYSPSRGIAEVHEELELVMLCRGIANERRVLANQKQAPLSLYTLSYAVVYTMAADTDCSNEFSDFLRLFVIRVNRIIFFYV